MADVLDYKIIGDDLQLVEIELDQGEGVRAEAGTMTYMEDGIEMQTGMGGDLFSGFKRMVTGESFFITTFLNNDQRKRHVAFAAPYRGRSWPLTWISSTGRSCVRKIPSCARPAGLRSKLPLRSAWAPASSAGKGLSCSA